MHTQTITTPAAHVLNASCAAIPPSADQFSIIASCSGVIATEFSYRKDEEIYGEGEPAEYVYQVIRGAVRTYKLLNDGRRQIGAFHLSGDVFGLDSGSAHRLTAEAITDTTVRLVKRRSLETAAGSNVRVAHNLWT
jgi:CRP/FNR family transcriptional regulator, nitrogen fixation regulation protein